MPITTAPLTDEDLDMIDAVSCNLGLRVGTFEANCVRKFYINDENVGYTLTYINEQDFNDALDAMWMHYEQLAHAH